MVPRVAALFLLFFVAASLARGQEVFSDSLSQPSPKSAARKSDAIQSAWLDLRQIPAANSKPQATP